jgi:glycopeptide antibiotics resistance protein
MDFIFARNNGFGFQQLSLLIVGLIVALAGVRSLVYPGRKTWDGVLLVVYLVGILFVGLKPSGLDGQVIWINSVLGIDVFSRSDFAINTLGFIPLGYLLMSCLEVESDAASWKRTLLFVLCCGLGVSLGLEILQYSIPGRYSSLYDLLANGLGTMIGIAFYVTGRLWERSAQRVA